MLAIRTEHRFPTLLLVAASCALSALAALRDPLLDAQAVEALVAAQALTADWSALSREAGSWSLHTVLIALVHTLGGLAYPASARLLDAALFALLAAGFARFVAWVGNELRFYGWAALVLLPFPALNQMRGHVLPDVGYWAFLACALALLARYRSRPRWQDAFQWAALIALAALFRAEALVFALVLPLACLQRDPLDGTGGGTLRLYAALGALALFPLLAAARLGGLDTLADLLFPGLTALWPTTVAGFSGAAARLPEVVPGVHGGVLAAIALFAALLVVLLAACLRTVGLAYAVLLVWATATRRAALPDTARRNVVHALLAGSLLIAAAHLARARELTARELMPLALAALVPAAFAARELLGTATRSRYPGLARAGLVGALIALLAQGFVSLGARTSQVSESIAWMHANLPREARVFSNDPQLAWYSGRAVDWPGVANARQLLLARAAPLATVDYWLIRVDTRDDALTGALAAYTDVLTPQARFAGRDGQVLLILRRTE